jgi:hypothetical protein
MAKKPRREAVAPFRRLDLLAQKYRYFSIEVF